MKTAQTLENLPVVLRLVLQGAKVDVVVAWVVSGTIGGTAGTFADGTFAGDIKSWSTSRTSVSTGDLVDVGLQNEKGLSLSTTLVQSNLSALVQLTT